MPAQILRILICALLAAFAVTAVAQDVETTVEKSTLPAAVADDLQLKVDGLVAELSSPIFGVRQEAAAQILKLESPAVGLLEVKLATASEPAATRLRQIVPRLRTRLFDDRVASLVGVTDPAALSGMPDWDRFVNITGNAEDALPVYLEMLQAEKTLFSHRMFSSSELSVHLEERSKVLRDACDGQQEKLFPIASAAALMLIASEETVVLRRATSTNISESLQDSRFGKLITDGFHAGMLRALTSEWLKRPGIAVDRPLLFSMEHRLPVGREIALRTLERRVYNQSAAYSLLCLGVLQQTDALSEVERVMNDQTASRPIWPPRGKNVNDLIPGRDVESTYSVQARDIALAVAIHLQGRQPQDFGMDVMTSDLHLFAFDSMGFNNDEARLEAISKYRASFPVREAIQPQ